MFEQFEYVCDLFSRFLRTVNDCDESRPVTSLQVDFFDTAAETRLPSPPPSSPVKPPRNVYAVDESQYLAKRMTTIQKDKQRQLSLDECIRTSTSRKTQPYKASRTAEMNGPMNFPNRSFRSLIEGVRACEGIDLPDGIISGRNPRRLESTGRGLQGGRIPFSNTAAATNERTLHDGEMDLLPGAPRAIKKSPSVTPRKNMNRKSKNFYGRGLNNPVLPSDSEVEPASRQIETTVRPMFSRINSLATTLNPWTIAAMNPPSKRARTESDAQALSISNSQSNSAPTISALFSDSCPPDVYLQTLVKTCRLSISDIVLGQRLLLADVPPPCDLIGFLLEYCS